LKNINLDDLEDGFVMRKGERIPVKIRRPQGQPIRRRSKAAFAMVPLRWVAEISEIKNVPFTVVWVSLIFAAWEAKGMPFKFSNDKLLGKCSRWAKMRILSELQDEGWIEFSQTGKQAPVVTFLKA
jgi:hypothetical protein